MAAEIVPLGATYSIAEPNADIVEMLESLLEKARRGEVIGVAVAWVDGAHGQFTGWRTGSTQNGAMIAATSMLAYRVVSATDLAGE